VAVRVQVVEDDLELLRLVVRGLGEEGFDVVASGDAGDALARVRAGVRSDVFVIDVGLPDADGRDLCQALRADGVDAPVLFLTALDAVPDRVAGFRAGGDDYLAKPFAFDELVARLRALVRRVAVAEAGAGGALDLDPARRTVACGGAEAALSATEFRILGALAARAGETLRRAEVAAAAWPPGAIVSENTIDAYVARLRRKLRSLPGSPAIATVRGVGYVLR
jgi:two-component system response regulator MprA